MFAASWLSPGKHARADRVLSVRMRDKFVFNACRDMPTKLLPVASNFAALIVGRLRFLGCRKG